MLTFHYTWTKSDLQRGNMLIFQYTYSKKTFRGMKMLIFHYTCSKVTSGKPAGASLQEELQKSKTNLYFVYLFSFCVFIKETRFSGSGAPGVLLGDPKVGP